MARSMNVIRIDPLEREFLRYVVASIISSDFRPVVRAEASIPIFVTEVGEPVRDVVMRVGKVDLRPGDVLITNFGSRQHINNTVTLTAPFHGDEITGDLANRAHWTAWGGLTRGGQTMEARTVLQEGTRYCGVRIARGGVLQRDVLATNQTNTCQKEALTGDAMAQFAVWLLRERRGRKQIVSCWQAGGEDIHRGGPGTVKEIEFLEECLSDTYPELRVPVGGKPGKIRFVGIKKPGEMTCIAPQGGSTMIGALPAGTIVQQNSGGGPYWPEGSIVIEVSGAAGGRSLNVA